MRADSVMGCMWGLRSELQTILSYEPPARTTVGGDIVIEGALVEVELIATV
jgi:hypothetical protein